MADTAADGWDDWSDGEGQQHAERATAAPSPPLGPVEVDEARVAFFEGQIKAYILDIADPAILESIDERLKTKRFESLAEYYMANEKLARYTVEHEVGRMAYRILQAGQPLAEEGDVAGAKGAYAAYPSALVWRFANQSLWAEVLGVLQHKFFRPDLDVAVVSRHSHFELDLEAESLVATSTFHVLLAAGDSAAASMVSGANDAAVGGDVVEVATVEGRVSLGIQERRLEQSVKLTGLKPVFDDAIRRLAESLAGHEARMHGHGHGPESPTRGVAALRDQVLVAAGGLRAVGKGATGLLQGATEAVSLLGQGLGSMILEEAAALEGDGVEKREQQQTQQMQRSGVATRVRPSMRRPAGGANAGAGAGGGGLGIAPPAAALENVMEGIVGGIGALTGAAGASQSTAGDDGAGLRLYRRDGEGPMAPHTETSQQQQSASSSSLLGSASDRLWGFVQQQYDGDKTLQEAASQPPPPPPPGPLPAPPSQLLSGLITGIGGFLASGVERAASAAAGDGDGPDEEGLPLGEMLRRKAAREAQQKGVYGGGGEAPLQVYRREGE